MNVALRTLSICTGGTAGLELGLSIAMGEVSPVCYVEREATAVQALVTRMEEGALPAAPVWSDLRTFDGTRLRGLVDAISAGLPCQPYSVAGKRKGDSDERAIWPEFIRVVGEVLPELVFLENVPEFLKHFRVIGEKLQGLGYVVEEPLFLAASDVGASHKRLRIFILAHLERSRFHRSAGQGVRADRLPLLASRSGFESSGVADAFSGKGRLQPERFSQCDPEAASEHRGNGLEHTEDLTRQLHQRPRGPGSGAAIASGSGGDVEDSRYYGPGRASEPAGIEERGPSGDDCRASRDVADSGAGLLPLPIGGPGGRNGFAGQGFQERGNESGLRESEAAERSGFENFPFAPGPEHSGLWRNILELFPHLAPAIEPGFRSVVDGASLVVDQSRTDQLRSLGNGVVPLQAAAAFTILARRAGLI